MAPDTKPLPRDLAPSLLSGKQRLLKNSSLLTFPVPKERGKLKDTHAHTQATTNIYILDLELCIVWKEK